MYNKDFDKIYPELKKAIINWMFEHSNEWQRLNACVDAFRAYIYADDGNAEITEDMYGAPLRVCSVKKLEAWLAGEIKTNDYRRLKPLLAFLRALKPNKWDELIAVHYGY